MPGRSKFICFGFPDVSNFFAVKNGVPCHWFFIINSPQLNVLLVGVVGGLSPRAHWFIFAMKQLLVKLLNFVFTLISLFSAIPFPPDQDKNC